MSPQSQLVSVSQIAQQASANPQTTPTAGVQTAANPQTAPAVPPKLVSVSDIAKNGVPDETAPAIQPHDQSAVAQGMADEGVTDYKPGQGIPYGHAGVGMRSGDITPSQAGEGLATISAAAGSAALPAVLPHTIEGVKAVGTWAAKNPVQAYLLYQVLKELVPGAKKVMGIASHAPDAP